MTSIIHTSLQRGLPWLDEAVRDVRYAVRTLRKSPGFTTVAVLTLALGIGVNASVFTVTNAVLFNGYPHVDPDNRIAYVSSPRGVSYADFLDWRARASSFEDLAVISSGGLRYRLDDRTAGGETCDVTRLSANSFRVLHHSPILGRDFLPSDEAPGAPAVAILSHALWQRRYASNPAIIGDTVRINDVQTTVIGVMAKDFTFPHYRVDLWMPIAPDSSLRDRQTRLLYFAFGRLAPRATFASARAEMESIGKALELAYPTTNAGIVPSVRAFHDAFMGTDSTRLYGTMWGAVGCVLLIACANLANLLLARSAGRGREISIRAALGAGRWRIVRQLLVESVLLSGMGGVLGWVIARWSVSAYQLIATPPGSYARWDFAMDHTVFAYLVLVSLVAGVLFGLAPVRRLARLDIGSCLKDGGRSATGGPTGRRLAAALVVVETALAVVLLSGAGLMLRSFLNFYQADIGVRPESLLTASVAMPLGARPNPEARLAFFDDLTTRMAAIPGVESVALTTTVPTYPGTPRGYELAGRPPVDARSRATVSMLVVGPGYFHTIGAPLIAGREFDKADDVSGAPVVVVNERFASAMWPDSSAIGRRVRLSGVADGTSPDVWRTIVGVAANVVQNASSRGRQFDPIVYVPFRQDPPLDPRVSMTLVARTAVPPLGVAETFRQQLHDMDADLVVGAGTGFGKGPAPLTDVLEFQAWSKAVNGGLFVFFAALALLLAGLGLYAVVAHAVSRRTQEIGIRTALGADARDIVRLVFAQGMLPVALGLAIGLAATLVVTPLLRSQLVGVTPMDSLSLIAAASALVLSAAVGCWLPARRATRIDPVLALRHD